MPFMEAGGYRQYYSVTGCGPLAVLLHGLFLDAESWRAAGVIDVLSERYQVVAIDALGHGRSDKPHDLRAYAPERQVAGVAAVLDAMGPGPAHFIGHSMGSWLAIGMAQHYRRRVASLVIGGWDVVLGSGALTADGKPVPFERLLAWARGTAPEILAWVTAEHEPGLRAAWQATMAMDASASSLLAIGAPVLLWCGLDDPYVPAMRAFAAAHQLKLELTPGDHVSAISEHGRTTAEMIKAFVTAVPDRSEKPVAPR